MKGMPPNQSCGFVIAYILQYVQHVQIMPVATFSGGIEEGGGVGFIGLHISHVYDRWV